MNDLTYRIRVREERNFAVTSNLYASDGEPMARVPKLAREIINTGTRRIPKKRRKMFFIINLRPTLNLSLFKPASIKALVELYDIRLLSHSFY